MFGLCMQVWCLLASMESADPRLIRYEGLVPRPFVQARRIAV